MAGIDNDVLFGINADYSNALAGRKASTTGQLLTNAQLWIGSTSANAGGTHINVGTLTSPGGTVTIGYSSPNITLDISGGGVAVETLTGNTGVATPVANNINVVTANTTVKFVGSGNTLTQDFGLDNLLMGSSGASITSGQSNSGYGLDSLLALTSGLRNSAFGAGALQVLTGAFDCTAIGFGSGTHVNGDGSTSVGSFALNNCTMGGNTAVGQSVLSATTSSTGCVGIGYLTLHGSTSSNDTCVGYNSGVSLLTGSGGHVFLGFETGFNLLSGTQDILIGMSSGFSYTGSESSNICINNSGVLGESNAIHIGTQGSGTGQQNTCFVAGITGVTTSNSQMVTINTVTGQLGAAAISGGTVTSVSVVTANGFAGTVATATTTPAITLTTTATGVLSGNGTAISGSAVTQFAVLVGGASNAVASTAVGATGTVLQGNTGAAPTYSTATYPSTTTINQILFSSAANTVTGLATANNGVLTTGTGGVPVITALASNGQLIIGSGSGAPIAATLTAGAGISITNAANSITIASTSAGFTWSETSGAFAAVKENGYFITATATATMPASPTEGDTIKFSVDTTNILTITANTGQTLRFSSAVSASAGTAVSTKQGDSVELTYKSTGTVWIAQNFVGNWVIT
jgi:hypothetical protein